MALDFLPGAKEASAFEEKDFAALHKSTLRKVEVIGKIALRAHDRQLKTNTTFWAMHGGRVSTLFRWIGEHPYFGIVAVVVGVGVSIVLAVCI